MRVRMRWYIALWAIVLIGAGLSLVVHKKNQVLVPHVPAFNVGDCYVRNGIREVWEPEADGKVLYKGIAQYVLMGSAEAERRHGGDKAGFPQSIESFDANHRKVLCPLAWKQKGMTK